MGFYVCSYRVVSKACFSAGFYGVCGWVQKNRKKSLKNRVFAILAIVSRVAWELQGLRDPCKYAQFLLSGRRAHVPIDWSPGFNGVCACVKKHVKVH